MQWTVDGINEAGLWNEATIGASSQHVLERLLWKEATMTASADEGGCESELSESRTDVCFPCGMWRITFLVP